MRTSQDIGKDFEKTLESVFSALTQSHAFKVHKFVDSHAAGNIVASQPSDYLLACEGTLFFCEAKASTKHKRFQRSMLRPAQRGAIMHYGMGLNNPYFILFQYRDEVHCLDAVGALAGSRINYDAALLFQCKTSELKEKLVTHWSLTDIKTMINNIRSYE